VSVSEILQVKDDVTTLQAADLIVDCLEKQGVTYIFGIPGAKIDKVFDVLKDRGPELIVCRHEQNAAFMAAAIGRLTGKPGVCLVTSGPGASNLATGLVTATSESDPVVALVGAVPRADKLKRTHQSMDNVALLHSITKYSVEVADPNSVAEAITNAFRAATSARPGAAVVSFPQDLHTYPVTVPPMRALPAPKMGPAATEDIARTAKRLREARFPVLLLGMRSSGPAETAAIRALLKKTPLPVVETFQGAGAISRELEKTFFGRVGIFRNQPGDELLARADLILTIGYDPIEYDPKFWNPSGKRSIIHLDEVPADIDNCYQPEIELLGDIAATVTSISDQLASLYFSMEISPVIADLRHRLDEPLEPAREPLPGTVHPLQIIKELRALIGDDVTVTCDVGTHYIWMARYFRSYEPRRLLFSNGMQTLGVALPWGIAASLVHPDEKVVSISGDGGFLFSAVELETAVRLKSNLVHLVWRDGTYDMVAFQQMMKYGRAAGVDFGEPDIVRFAESFGAKGLRVTSPDDLVPVLKQALDTQGPVVVDIPVDYSNSVELGENLLPDQIN
jgi:acetolactate synthase, catabolic